LGQRANPATTLLRQDRLQHREHRLGRLGCGLVAHQVGQLIAARVNRTHIAAKVVHEDFRRLWRALHLRHALAFVVVLALGLTIFVGWLKPVTNGKTVVAAALTLAVLVLPVIIITATEAIRAVPAGLRDAGYGVGASKWEVMRDHVLPYAAPGILTGTVISMGRAAGETAPIIFTAAVSVGRLIRPAELLTQPTPALSWNLYNICTEHEAVDEIRHVQYGMAATLVVIVLILNLTAIVIRARVARRLKG
jgi:phosphate transport system permease protein